MNKRNYFETPKEVEVVGGVEYNKPVVREMFQDGFREFKPERLDPRELVSVVGYDGREDTNFLGAFPIGELDDAIQGHHNSGFSEIYVIRKGEKAKIVDRVLALDLKDGSEENLSELTDTKITEILRGVL